MSFKTERGSSRDDQSLLGSTNELIFNPLKIYFGTHEKDLDKNSEAQDATEAIEGQKFYIVYRFKTRPKDQEGLHAKQP